MAFRKAPRADFLPPSPFETRPAKSGLPDLAISDADLGNSRDRLTLFRMRAVGGSLHPIALVPALTGIETVSSMRDRPGSRVHEEKHQRQRSW